METRTSFSYRETPKRRSIKKPKIGSLAGLAGIGAIMALTAFGLKNLDKNKKPEIDPLRDPKATTDKLDPGVSNQSVSPPNPETNLVLEPTTSNEKPSQEARLDHEVELTSIEPDTSSQAKPEEEDKKSALELEKEQAEVFQKVIDCINQTYGNGEDGEDEEDGENGRENVQVVAESEMIYIKTDVCPTSPASDEVGLRPTLVDTRDFPPISALSSDNIEGYGIRLSASGLSELPDQLVSKDANCPEIIAHIEKIAKSKEWVNDDLIPALKQQGLAITDNARCEDLYVYFEEFPRNWLNIKLKNFVDNDSGTIILYYQNILSGDAASLAKEIAKRLKENIKNEEKETENLLANIDWLVGKLKEAGLITYLDENYQKREFPVGIQIDGQNENQPFRSQFRINLSKETDNAHIDVYEYTDKDCQNRHQYYFRDFGELVVYIQKAYKIKLY